MKRDPSLKTIVALLALSGLLVAGVSIFPGSLTAQENDAQENDAQETAQESAAAPTRKPPKGRVPNHYGKVGLTSEQKDEIYAIQAKYREQIESLQTQINDLQQQEASEIYLVLTDFQKEALQKILDEVAERRKKE